MTGLHEHEKFAWTPEAKDRLAKLWAAGVPVREIGRRLGCGHNAVVGMRRRMGLPERGAVTQQGVGFMHHRLGEAKALADEGLGAVAIAERMGVSRSSAQWALCEIRRRGGEIPRIPSVPPPRRDTGVLGGRMDEVRRLAEAGLRATGVAMELGVTVDVAQKALDRLRREGVDIPKMPKPPRVAGRERPLPRPRAKAPPPRQEPRVARGPGVEAPPPKAEPPPPVVVVRRSGEACRWPSVSGDRIVFACTAGAEPGACSPYCAEHLARAWDPLPKRRAA